MNGNEILKVATALQAIFSQKKVRFTQTFHAGKMVLVDIPPAYDISRGKRIAD